MANGGTTAAVDNVLDNVNTGDIVFEVGVIYGISYIEAGCLKNQ